MRSTARRSPARARSSDRAVAPEQGTVGLADRAVIVTGASSGIGEATARLLRAAGPDPVLVARRSDRLGALSNDLGGALAVSADVARPDDPARIIVAALEQVNTEVVVSTSATVDRMFGYAAGPSSRRWARVQACPERS